MSRGRSTVIVLGLLVALPTRAEPQAPTFRFLTPGGPCDVRESVPGWLCLLLEPGGFATQMCHLAKVPFRLGWRPWGEACDFECTCGPGTTCVVHDMYRWCLPRCLHDGDCHEGQACHRLAFTQTRACLPLRWVGWMATEQPPRRVPTFWKWVPPQSFAPTDPRRFLEEWACGPGRCRPFGLGGR